eukprot:s1891_g7.t1
MDEIYKCFGKTYEHQEIFLASAAKRQKVEVKIKDLTPEEAKLFAKAKDKEKDSWLSTDTVRRILRSQVPEGQLLRSRWVLTWKSLDDIEQKELNMVRKPKARLVILGYEDPLIDTLPRDSPTLGRDSRMIALQCIASHKWSARSFDIRTAFLRGSRQDNRILGVELPPEMRTRMGLKSNEVCSLLKGAYGLINAPLLWYSELKSALLSLNFIVSPLDPCLFVLPKKHHDPHASSQIHGILCVHVDDGLGGGDSMYDQAIREIHWSWLLNPKLEWKNPDETLKQLPGAFAVVDCKSLFDLLQKTSVPQCSEYRTMLEALVVKERLKEGVTIKCSSEGLGRPSHTVCGHSNKGSDAHLAGHLGLQGLLQELTAQHLKIPFGPHKGDPILSVVGAARQDSGSLEAFASLARSFGFGGSLMASDAGRSKSRAEPWEGPEKMEELMEETNGG